MFKLHAPIVDHSWSPTNPYMAVFTKDYKNFPARILIYKVPDLTQPIGQNSANLVEAV